MLCSFGFLACHLYTHNEHIQHTAIGSSWNVRCATVVWVAAYNDVYKFPYLNYLRIHLVVSQFICSIPLYYAKQRTQLEYANVCPVLDGFVGCLSCWLVVCVVRAIRFYFPVVDVVVRRKTISSGVRIVFIAHMSNGGGSGAGWTHKYKFALPKDLQPRTPILDPINRPLSLLHDVSPVPSFSAATKNIILCT